MQRSLDARGSLKSWDALLLPPHIQAALRDAGFRRPSPVQEAALPLARLGADGIVQAKAGTGKTLVFAVAAVERVDLANGAPQVLVLAPTREIALQGAEAVSLAAAALPPPGLACGTFIGGLPVDEDEKQLRRACHVAVGTTGRILSLIQRGALHTGAVRMLVLDEADKLLGDSFRKEAMAILAALPQRRQLLALSATYAPEALAELRRLMGGRQQEVLLCADDTALLGVRQCYQLLLAETSAEPLASGAASGGGSTPHLEARLAALLRLLSAVSFQQAVVFCKYRADAELVVDRLLDAGYPAAYLSGQRTQLQRIEALNALRDFRLRVVVTTDLVARGVDLDRVNLVVNMELPGDAATYMHRVGRAGRFGTRGLAVTLLEGPEQLPKLQGYLAEVAGGEVTELPEQVPEDWYLHSCQLAQQAQHSPATPTVSIGPATPAAAAGVLAATTADSWGGGGGALGDIATASLWLDDVQEEEEEGVSLFQPQQQQQQQQQQWDDEGVDISYTVVPKPPAPVAGVAPVPTAPASSAAASAPGSAATSPTSGKPLVSSLTAAVAAAEASSKAVAGAAAGGDGSGRHRCDGADPDASEGSSVCSWASSSDDEYSGSSGSDAEVTAGAAGVPRAATFKPLRRIGSTSSGSSGSSSSSGRLASPPAPIPGRTLVPEMLRGLQGELRRMWDGSFEQLQPGGSLAEAAAEATALPQDAAQVAATVLAGGGGSHEEEPSFKDSWLVQSEPNVAQSAAEEQRRQRHAAAAAAAAAGFELKPHRHHRHRHTAAAGPAAAAPGGGPAPAQQQSARMELPQPPTQQQPDQQQGHYWDVVHSVEKDVLSRADGPIGTAAASASAAAGTAKRAAEPAAGAAEDEGSEGEFEPVVPRQRRPLGSAQAHAARRRHDDAAAERAAEAATLEALAEQQEAEAAAAAGDGAATAGDTADQQRQWTEFWHAHYAYYGCYPGESTWVAGGDAAGTGADPGSPQQAAAAAAAADAAASGTLPAPPPAPPSPPPALSPATWAPAGVVEQQAAAGAEGGAAGDGSLVQVPSSLLARYQQLEWEEWRRQHAEWQQLWEQYKQYWAELYNAQQQAAQALVEQQHQAAEPPHPH